MRLSHSQKFLVIIQSFSQEGSDATATPLNRAGELVGLGRTKASALANNPDACLKNPKKIKSLDEGFSKKLAMPGSTAYRETFEDVIKKLESSDRNALNDLDRYIVPLALGEWSTITLDSSKPASERLLAGSLAQRVIFDTCYKRSRGRKQIGGGAFRISDGQLVSRGRQVIDTVVDLIGQHSTAPEGLFEQSASTAATKAGHRFFRIQMHSHQTGWYGIDLKDDRLRADHYAKAYHNGLANDLMWLHSIFTTREVSHSNNAWNLALHAGAWDQSLPYAAELFKYFPKLISEKVQGLTPAYLDRTVWPGIAAIVADTQIAALDRVREELGKLEKAAEAMVPMMTAVRKMVPSVIAKLGYVEVLEMGKEQ
jgi:hypothetical protein